MKLAKVKGKHHTSYFNILWNTSKYFEVLWMYFKVQKYDVSPLGKVQGVYWWKYSGLSPIGESHIGEIPKPQCITVFQISSYFQILCRPCIFVQVMRKYYQHMWTSIWFFRNYTIRIKDSYSLVAKSHPPNFTLVAERIT